MPSKSIDLARCRRFKEEHNHPKHNHQFQHQHQQRPWLINLLPPSIVLLATYGCNMPHVVIAALR
jgi:hypothetical protein